MRNLKKLLALVLAMMMAFSLMLTANAANPVRDYPDADQADEAFEEAIDVLTGMKVYSGDNGNFKPAATITRAEVAALIYRLATGDVDDSQANLYAEYGNFPDVPHDAWYAGYVGYCANAGYIKGRSNGNFDPSGNVTGYEALAMILRAIGYDKNGEFTGATWQTEVSALSQQLGILDNVKTTQYGGTLYLAARRDVVADLLFRADAYVNMVKYTPAFGYQPYGDVNGSSSSLTGGTPNNTLGWKVFGLTSSSTGVVIGNQQTGEKNTRLGWSGSVEYYASQPNAQANIKSTQPFSAFTWAGADSGVDNTDANGVTSNVLIGNNDIFNLETGVDLFGHRIKIWFDGRGSSFDSVKGRPTYAYFDKATTEVVYADNTDLTTAGADGTDSVTSLREAIVGAKFKVSNQEAVFTNSFGKFGKLNEVDDIAGTVTGAKDVNTGDGVAVDGTNDAGDTTDAAFVSPVKLYKVICNNTNDVIDAVVALNIESSQVTEANNVNRVPTLGLPVQNLGDNTYTNGSEFILGNGDNGDTAAENVKLVPANGVSTGVIAQAALVGDSVKSLGEYEMGIHITGTTTRAPISAAEKAAINGAANGETAWFLLNKVTATVEGKVVSYNRTAGTVTLDNGTVLERSKFYDTVVITNPANHGSQTTPDPVDSSHAPISAIPQAWVWDAGVTPVAGTRTDLVDQWVEGYANTTYKFYTDYEGKYLGAERSTGTSFLYGTYLDYEQKTSTSTFNYFLTGVTLDGQIETKQVSKFWDAGTLTATTGLTAINGTNALNVPFRDSTSINGIGNGLYSGFAISGDTVDGITTDSNTNRNEYLANMARLGVKYGADAATPFTAQIDIDNDSVTLGAEETAGASKRYLTEATKFILVSGFGTDTVKAEVYDGISKLRGSASHVFINPNYTVYDEGDWGTTPPTATEVRIPGITEDTTMAEMTYYKESPYTYAQSGDTDMKIDVVVLPKAAVTWSGGSGLYYVGNTSYSSINSWGTDAWKYDLYEDGELRQVWLTNDPNDNTSLTPGTNDDTYNICKDSFYNLKDTGEKANDGQPIYTAGSYNAAGVWSGSVSVTVNPDPTTLVVGTGDTYQWTMTNGAAGTGVRYSAITRDAQTATFSTYNGSADSNQKLFRVAGAKVVNLNKDAKASGALSDWNKSASGEIWSGITDLATLNEAGSINPVTGRALKVAAVVDPANPLVVTTIYVCYDQSWS